MGRTKLPETITLTAESTYGDKIRAARAAKNMSQGTLSELTGLTTRAIRYYENNQRVPSADVIKKMADALGLTTNYFMDDTAFQEELERETFLAEAKDKYGSRGKAQAKRITEEARALYAGGELSEADKQGFMEEMMEIFMISKEEAKKYTPKAYLKE
jgi:transcriptional regulator with XRE-family HTH domain